MSEETHDWAAVDGELNVERCQRQDCAVRRYLRFGGMWQRKKGGHWRSMTREPVPVCRGASAASSAKHASAIDELARRVSIAAYTATVKLFEEAEYADLIVGNGHHMAQDVAEKAKNLLLERHRKRLGK